MREKAILEILERKYHLMSHCNPYGSTKGYPFILEYKIRESVFVSDTMKQQSKQRLAATLTETMLHSRFRSHVHFFHAKFFAVNIKIE